MKKMIIPLLIMILPNSVHAFALVHYGWEDGGTVLNIYPDPELPSLIATNVSPSWDGNVVHEGNYSLKLEYNAANGTPQAFVAYLWCLDDGDTYRVGFHRYDDTPYETPSVRIWAHWNDHLPNDPLANDGDAGGNEDYGSGEGWDYTDWIWTVTDGHTGLVIEARVEGEPGDAVWLDDLDIWPMEGTDDRFYYQIPGSEPVFTGVITAEQYTWSQLKALYR